MTNPVVLAIAELKIRIAEGRLEGILVETDDFTEPDEMDRAAILQFFYEAD